MEISATIKKFLSGASAYQMDYKEPFRITKEMLEASPIFRYYSSNGMKKQMKREAEKKICGGRYSDTT